MKLPRKAGILLHVTSLPCSDGIGTFGKCAFDFVNFLSESKISLWQVLPLGPTGYGDSPYQSFSTFALNPLLIDFEDLCDKGWTSKKDIKPPKWIKKSGAVDYGAVTYWKNGALKKIAEKFLKAITNPDSEKDLPSLDSDEILEIKSNFFAFCRENLFWLKDYAAFMSIKNFYDEKAQKQREETNQDVNGSWTSFWPEKLARHDQNEVEKWINSHTEEFLQTEAIQFFAFTQWKELHEYAKSKNVEIIGDIPIFVSPDSSDVWANQNLFQIDENGEFENVAGVPPDYFSATGQLWGNPLYDWQKMKSSNYEWWILRIKKSLELYDWLRIDHFRGFDTYWAIPFGSETAVGGEWKKGPGKEFFDAVKKELGDLPLIAEDLGEITDDVRKLRDDCEFPGMKILQFAFDKNEYNAGGMKNAFLPHSYENANCVCYTGTHDNYTTQGWFETLNDEMISLVASYVKGEKVSAEKARAMQKSGELCRSLVRLAFSSTASFAVIPLQDLYCVGDEGRMNAPGTSGSNWAWRAEKNMIEESPKSKKIKSWLEELSRLYNR